MEEDERKQKLRAGKEKLAQFQKKKKKHKSHDTEPVGTFEKTSSAPLETVDTSHQSSLAANFVYDSDSQWTSSVSEEDTSGTEDGACSRAYASVKAKLQEKSTRVEELEESLMGKQLALDKVIQENDTLRDQSSISQKCVEQDNENPPAITAEYQDSIVSQGSKIVNQSELPGTQSIEIINGAENHSDNKMADFQELVMTVQWLKLQLNQASGTLQAQNDKQKCTVTALQLAKDEILVLQDSITQKDSIVTELAEKLTIVSTEYGSFKQEYVNLVKNEVDDRIKELEEKLKQKELREMELLAEIKNVEEDKVIEVERIKTLYDGNAAQLTKELNSKVEQLESENVNILKESNDFQAKSDELIREIADLNEKNDILTKDLNKLEEENEKLMSVENQLKVQMGELQTLNADILNEKEDLKAQLAALEIQNVENVSDFKSLEDQFKDLQIVKNNSEDQLKELNDNFETKQRLHDELEVNYKNATDELEKLTEDNVMYQTQIEEYEDKISQSGDFMEENHSLRIQNDELYNKINNQKDVIASIKGELGVVSVENAQVIGQLSELSICLESCKEEIANLNTENGSLKSTVDELTAMLEKVNSENVQYKKTNLSLDHEIQNLKQELQDTAESQRNIELHVEEDIQTEVLVNDVNQNFENKLKPVEELFYHQETIQIQPEIEERLQASCSESYESLENPSNSLVTSSLENQIIIMDEETESELPNVKQSCSEEFIVVNDCDSDSIAEDINAIENCDLVNVNMNANNDEKAEVEDNMDVVVKTYSLSSAKDETEKGRSRVVELENELSLLKSELLLLRSENTVTESSNGAIHKVKIGEHQDVADASDLLESNVKSTDSEIEDTLQKKNKEISDLKQSLETIQLEFDNISQELTHQNEECETLRKENVSLKEPKSESSRKHTGLPEIESSCNDLPTFVNSQTTTSMLTRPEALDLELETLRGQYDSQLEGLREELGRIRRGSGSDDGNTGGRTSPRLQQHKVAREELGKALPGEQKEQLETLVSDLDKTYQDEMEEMHAKHVDDVDDQVKAMRSTLEEIYSSQLELVRSELYQNNQVALVELREALAREHTEDINKLDLQHDNRIEELKQQYEDDLRQSKLNDSLVVQTIEVSLPFGKEDSAAFITKLSDKLTKEHREILDRIQDDLDKESHLSSGKQNGAHVSQTGSEVDETESVRSTPVTQSEFDHIQDKQSVLKSAEDVKVTLASQCEEIATLRGQMLGEYEQLLSVRAEVMSSQSAEVGQLQQEMAQIQQTYEEQMALFQDKVTEQTETALRSELDTTHTQALDEMKQYYETKVSEMEQSYTTDITQLKQEHSELLARLQGEVTSPTSTPRSPGSSPLSTAQLDKQRQYVRKTTTLTAISDEEEELTPPSSPSTTNQMLEGRLRTLEDKLKEREKLVDELKKRLEAETTSAEDLHGKLLDSNKALCDYEDSFKARSDEIEELQKELTSRDGRIIELESKLEKAALEERGEKDKDLTKVSDSELVNELKEKVKQLEQDLSASKESNTKLQQELNQLDEQHGEAIMKLKEEMDNLNQSKISELEGGFEIQLEEELKQQAEELENKFNSEIQRQAEEINIYKQNETDFKSKLQNIEAVYEKQLNEVKEKSEMEVREVEEPLIVVSEMNETQTTSPTQSSSELDRSSLETSIRENVKAEILEEYEESIDTLKNEYEVRIDELNLKLQTLESAREEESQLFEKEKDESVEKDQSETETESVLREKLKTEIAQEFKDRLQNVTDEYESKLKDLQDKVDKQAVQSPKHTPVLVKSQSLDVDPNTPTKERVATKTAEYEGFVGTIRREYEDRIKTLQNEIAQYKSNLEIVPSTPLSPNAQEMFSLEKAQGDSAMKQEEKHSPDAGSDIPAQIGSPELRNQVYDEIAKEFELTFKNLKADYEKQLQDLTEKVSVLESDGANQSDMDNKIREEVTNEYEQKIAAIKQEYEAKVKKLTEHLEKAVAEKASAEKKVKADMFVWHEETVTQVKRKHEETISQLRKENEEKMDLYREEIQEEHEQEKENIRHEHKQELQDLEERYDTLVEGLRTGEVPEVAEMVQEKYDMEMEMARTLIQQECDETIESEQSRISEEYEQQIKTILYQKEAALEEQHVRHEKEVSDLRNTLLQQYESQIIEMQSVHQASMEKAQLDFEALIVKAQLDTVKDSQETEETLAAETITALKSPLSITETSPKEQVSVESKTSEDDVEKDDESEKIVTSTVTESGSDKSDTDDDDHEGADGVRADTEQKENTDTDGKGIDTDKDVVDGNGKVTETKEATTEEDSQVKADSTTAPQETNGDVVQQLRQELAEKIQEYEAMITNLKAVHEAEIDQLSAELQEKDTEYAAKVREMEDTHEQQIQEYQSQLDKLKEGLPDSESSEALEMAHQQELQDLEDRLVLKHKHDIDNLEKQHQSRMDDIAEKHAMVVEQLRQEVFEAQRAMDQYPDIMSPAQAVPTFHGGSTLGSSRQSTEDFMVPSSSSHEDDEQQQEVMETMAQLHATHSEQGTGAIETGAFTARTSSDSSPKGTLQGTLEMQAELDVSVGVVSLDTTIDQSRDDISMDQSRADTSMDQSRGDTSMDQSRGTLRGVDDTTDAELIEFSEEDSDKSTEEVTESQKSSERAVSPGSALMQTLGYGVASGPTVKSLDDTIDSSFRLSEREDMAAKIKELEGEVEDLKRKLESELSKQDDQMERLDREKQEEGNLVAMLRADIERLSNDREAFQNTNEHLLGLLSDAVKTYMSVEETINKKLKTMMDKSVSNGDKSGDKGRPGSAERKKTPPPGATRRSPVSMASPGRLSPARPDDGDNVQETSILSNITDEGLDLSQRITDSIFQGPDLASEEEELLTDSGGRLRTSVTHLLDMVEETTNQLLDTKQTQGDVVATLEGRGHDLEQITSRCSDLEERLREEVERKDFLALELHKAEGLIEGYTAERDTQDQRLQDLTDQKEALVLELETSRNKLLDMTTTQRENEMLRKELTDQQELITQNVGEEAQALMLEVTRLNSENREKEAQIQQFHDKYENRVRQLENSGEDMESHFSNLLDDRKQEVTDLKLHLDALEKQLKAKKQFIEEQSSEREQEHEDYQRDLEHWKKMVQDLEKQNGAETRLQREIDDMTEQLQSRIDLHNQALLDSEKFQRESRDKDDTMKELNSFIRQLEQELQDKIQQAELNKQKIQKLEEELSRRPFADEDLLESIKSDGSDKKTGSSLEFDDSAAQKQARLAAQMTVEEEIRQAANKTKEELVREKHALQTQVNECLVQISALRNQLDEMRHRRDLGGDTSNTALRLETEREKSEEKERQISELKLDLEEMSERLINRDQQIEQLRDHDHIKLRATLEGVEYDSDSEVHKQLETLNKENKKLKDRVKIMETSSTVTDMSGLSQTLIEEKNQEIDHLSGQLLKLQSDFTELKAENGVHDVYEELEAVKQELSQRERELADIQPPSVHVSAAFTDHSLTPDSSMLNVGASFSEKASIQQELEESESNRLERVAFLESELSSLKSALQVKEEQVVTLQDRVKEMEENSAEDKLASSQTDDVNMLQDMIQEKEELITQLTVQIDGLQTEVDNLSDFQNKLQEDFDTVQTMLEEKDREIESLTKELTDRSPPGTDEHSLVIKHEVEISRLRKESREKDNVVEEKLEEIAEMSDKIELLDSHVKKYKVQEQEYDEQIIEKERAIQTLEKQVEKALLVAIPPPIPMSEDEKDEIIREKTEEIEQLKQEVLGASLGRPPSPPLSKDQKSQLIRQQSEEIIVLKDNVQKLLGRPPSPPLSDDEKTATIEKQKQEILTLKTQVEAVSLGRPPFVPGAEYEGAGSADVVARLREEIDKLKQQIMDANLSEDDKYVLIRELRLENETLKRQVDAALKIRPPSPPLDEEEKSELIRTQEQEILRLSSQVEAALKIRPPSPPMSDDEKSIVIKQQEKEITKLKQQVQSAITVASLPPWKVSEDEKAKTVEQKEREVTQLKIELTKVTEAVENGEQGRLITEKVEEVIQLKKELSEVKQQLERVDVQSPDSVHETVVEKDKQLEEVKHEVQRLEEELQSAKEVRAYEDEIELKEKEDEIDELKEELESYRSRLESSLGRSTELEMSLNGESELRDSRQLERSRSFYKDEYEEKCSENRQLQVSLDLAKNRLESESIAEAPEEIELFKAELERKNEKMMEELVTEKEELQQEVTILKEKLGQDQDVRVANLEKELEKTKVELTKERMESVEALNEVEIIRDRKEKERRGSLKSIQELENDLQDKISKERQLNNQIRQLSEELTLIRRQYGLADKDKSSDSQLKFDTQDTFVLGNDVETLQQQVMQFKQHSDKARDILAEKQKYQSQLVKLEIQHENLQKKMKKEVSELESQVKSYASEQAKQPAEDVWVQLHATQERLEKTTQQLSETSKHLNETDNKLQEVNNELDAKVGDMRELQEDLWKTSGQLSVTSGKLQEVEEKLKLTLSQVTEREDQIHQLQGELQHTQHEAEQVSKQVKATASVDSQTQEQVQKLRRQLTSSETELDAIKKSLTEAVDMSEQQLQITENKDQEYVKLKLDIQQTIANKDKVIRDQKQTIKEKEKEVAKVKQEHQQAVTTKERQIGKLREEMEQQSRGGANDEITTMKAQLQKVMNLKDELSTEHQRHIQEMSTRAQQDTETQLATMRIKYTDEIDHIKRLHNKDVDEKLIDVQKRLERKHKGETNRLILRHQEEVTVLKSRAGVDQDASPSTSTRQGGVGQDRNGTSTMNGHSPPTGTMSDKLQGILHRLHNEGVQVLTISELECLNRSQAQGALPPDVDPESMKAGWENERQSLLSTIQSLKDLLAQTHKLRGLDKDDDNDDDYYASIEGSDWRAELLRAIGYVFTKERESLLAELRSHVLSHPNTNIDEVQRLEQKIRTQEAHHHASLDQIFSADRQSMLAEIRDLRAHATISRMHQQEERDRMNEKNTSSEDLALKKERQLKRQVQLLEFKIQQEKVLQEDLRASLDSERHRTGDLSSLLNQEKSSNLDLQSNLSALQVQAAKLKESLEREQSRYVSVTNALEEEKSKSLNLSELLESERETLWRARSEVENLKYQQPNIDPRHLQELQTELECERELRCQLESQNEVTGVTIDNLRQEVEMEKRHQHAIETEMSAKVTQLHKAVDTEKHRHVEIEKALEREKTLTARLQRSLEAEKSNSDQLTGRERAIMDDLHAQLAAERAKSDDLSNALQRELGARDDVSSSAESEKSLLKDHLNQERALNEDLKHDLDKLQFERLEAMNKYQKEHELASQLKSERDQINEDLRKLRSLEMQRDHDREADRLSDKKSVRQADREREDYRMKLHEQELETQRLTQKACSLEDQMAECRENELRTIRELEQEKIRNMEVTQQQADMISVQTSPRHDMTDGGSIESIDDRQERCQVYRSQLESMCQSLHYLVLRCREQFNKASHSGPRTTDVNDFDAVQTSLRDLLSEVKQLQEIEGDFMSHPSGSVNERVLRQNEELTNFVARISEEKTELRNTLSRLEEEIWKYRKMDSKIQELQRTSEVTDHVLIAERAEWAKEKLSLQMALNSTEREVDLLQTDLRVERERRVAAGITDARDTDKVKIQRLYGKYLRAESFRKALIYQKKYLLLLLGGFQDTEETTLALLARMGALDSERHSQRKRKNKPLTTFRGAVRVVIAISRMKYLVNKWRRATRVGSEVVAGTVDQTNGYMPQSSSYSPPRKPPSPRRAATKPVRSSLSPPRATTTHTYQARHTSPQRSSDPAPYFSPRTHLDYDSYSSSSYMSTRPTNTSVTNHTTTRIPSTPPTKDYTSTTQYTSPSSGARRKILTTASIPTGGSNRVRFMSEDSGTTGELGDNDDYIHRLENLQTRLGTLQNGKKASWQHPWR